MSEKEKPESDDRDVFEKALDYAPFAGMVLGGMLGWRSGRKDGIKAWKKVDSLEAKIRKLEAKGRNPNVGLTPKEMAEYRKAQEELQYALGKGGENIAGRVMIKAPLGAVIGHTAGSAAKDAYPKRRK